jgi:hypothetical protein
MLQTARVLEPEQRTLNIGFSQVTFGTGEVDSEISDTLPGRVPVRTGMNMLSASGYESVAGGVDMGVLFGGPIPTDSSLSGTVYGPAVLDAKFRLFGGESYQSALTAGVGVSQFAQRISLGPDDSEPANEKDQERYGLPAVEFSHAETGLQFLNSFYVGAFGLHLNPGVKLRSTRASYFGPLKGSTDGKYERVVLYSKRGFIRGLTLGLSLGSPFGMKLLAMAGQYFDEKGAVAEAHATLGFAEIMTERMGSGKTRGSESGGLAGSKRLTGGLLTRAGIGGAELALSIPNGESTTTGVAALTYKINPLKHGGTSLSEEAIASGAGTGGVVFKEWFPWKSQGSCYFRVGAGYLRYPERDKYIGVDLGFGERWVLGNVAIDISWLQLMVLASQIEKPEEDSGVKSRNPGVRTPGFGIGYAF